MRNTILIGTLLLTLMLSACKDDPQVIYEVNKVELYQSANEKNTLKTEIEFISIAYSDLYGKSISTDLLEDLQIDLLSFGDNGYMQDLIIRNFLNNNEAQIPTDAEMRTDVEQFIEDAYLRFYNRFPTEIEQWKLQEVINGDATVMPDVIYYAIMTADEYRYY